MMIKMARTAIQFATSIGRCNLIVTILDHEKDQGVSFQESIHLNEFIGARLLWLPCMGRSKLKNAA